MNDSSRPALFNHDLQRPRDFRRVGRAMECARVARATHVAALAATVERAVGRGAIRAIGWPRPTRATLVIAALAAAAVLALSIPVFAQEAQEMAVATDRDDAGKDRLLLAQLGLAADAIERCDDVPLLWRAVRELVLTHRVSEPMQQRLLRRVWMADPELRASSFVDSPAN